MTKDTDIALLQAHETQELLRQGTYDLPRMSKILESDRVRHIIKMPPPLLTLCRSAQVFLLIDEGTIRRYKSDLTEEIEPQINELLSRAEKGLQVLVKKESILQAKVSVAKNASFCLV